MLQPSVQQFYCAFLPGHALVQVTNCLGIHTLRAAARYACPVQYTIPRLFEKHKLQKGISRNKKARQDRHDVIIKKGQSHDDGNDDDNETQWRYLTTTKKIKIDMSWRGQCHDDGNDNGNDDDNETRLRYLTTTKTIRWRRRGRWWRHDDGNDDDNETRRRYLTTTTRKMTTRRKMIKTQRWRWRRLW